MSKFFKKLRKYRRIFYLLGLIAMIFIFFKLQSDYKNTTCSNIIVTILDSNEANYVTQSTINNYLYIEAGVEILGNKFKNIDLALIEEELSKNYYIKNVEVFRSNKNIIEIKVTQRKPVMRIYTSSSDNFYIDEEGFVLPPSDNYASYVPVFNGNIPLVDSLFTGKLKNISEEIFDSTNYRIMFDLALLISKDSFIQALIDQVYVNDKKEFVLIPKVGDFTIVFGNMDEAEKKIRNLKAFYLEAAPKLGWNKYKEINLKYTNQIIGVKNI